MKICATCGHKFRKLNPAFVIGLGMNEVCKECASWGLLVVSIRPPYAGNFVKANPKKSKKV